MNPNRRKTQYKCSHWKEVCVLVQQKRDNRTKENINDLFRELSGLETSYVKTPYFIKHCLALYTSPGRFYLPLLDV